MLNLLKTVAAIFLFLAVPISVLDYYARNDFIERFMAEQSMQIFGGVLAIYVAAASAFLSILMDRERQTGRVIFNGTGAELKSTIIFVFSLFAIQFVLLIISPPSAFFSEAFQKQPVYEYVRGAVSALQVTNFFLFIYALYELSVELFAIRDKLHSRE